MLNAKKVGHPSVPARLAAFLVVVLVVAATACSGKEAGGGGPSSSTATGMTTTTAAAMWETYDSVEELARAATLVAIVEVGAELRRFPVLEEDGSQAFTRVIHVARVEEVILGDEFLASRSIEISYIDMGAPTPNITPYREGERLVMFLAPTGPTAEGSWAPLSSNEGVFEFTADEHVLTRGLGPLAGRQLSIEEFKRLVGTAS